MFRIVLTASVVLMAMLIQSGLSFAADASGSAPKTERRCGWFENPTPSKATLTDRDGEWEIAIQGGHQANGDWPEFNAAQWVMTHGHHGYGCMSMTVNPMSHKVLSIANAKATQLETCRHDPALHEPAHAASPADANDG